MLISTKCQLPRFYKLFVNVILSFDSMQITSHISLDNNSRYPNPDEEITKPSRSKPSLNIGDRSP
jgi:hypothetical protein